MKGYTTEKPVLQVKGLSTTFYTPAGEIGAVEKVSFSLRQNRCLALIGESGAGKSVTALSLLRMIPSPGRIKEGQILFNGSDLLSLPISKMREVRGDGISLMFQDSLTAFNPVLTIGAQIKETVMTHRALGGREAEQVVKEKLASLKLPAGRVFGSYPFQLSGGMRQRAALALALVLHPNVLIADEPTSSLDVTLQEQILAELEYQLEECCLSILFITHDLGAAAAIADEVAVMYSGHIMEQGALKHVYEEPLHPYTRALLNAHPTYCRGGRLSSIPGNAALASEKIKGCPFHPRCHFVEPLCCELMPQVARLEGGREVACHRVKGEVSWFEKGAVPDHFAGHGAHQILQYKA